MEGLKVYIRALDELGILYTKDTDIDPDKVYEVSVYPQGTGKRCMTLGQNLVVIPVLPIVNRP